MRKVILESPYSGDVETHTTYARRCLEDSLRRGEAPLASHLLYTQPGVLDDANHHDRALGIQAGHVWMDVAEALVVYTDLGLSKGMIAGISRAKWLGIPIEYRKLKKF